MALAHSIDENPRTDDIQICQDTTFDTMMLSPNVLNGLLNAGFYKPSPIQLLGIPLGKLGLDLLLEAKSGTGKTVVFSTIALELLDLNKGLQVIIVTPTREIAVQICDVLNQIGSKCEGLSIEVVIGGLSYKDDIAKMQEKFHILVGTPGRLKYLIQDKHIDVSATRLLILDEADKLMDKSFHKDIKNIHAALPKQKQVIMSSATYPEIVMDAINELVQDAQHVCPNSSNVLLGVSHRVTYVGYNSNSVRQTELRFAELTKILTVTQFKQCVIFCKYQARVTQLHKMLTKAKWPAELVYGKQDQTVRLEALKTLQDYKCRILISTDLVARGIDAKNVDLVINFEPPDTCETYLHRIGRSGRYGTIGMAISIVTEGTEKNNFNKMLEPIAKTVDLKYFWTEEHIGSIMEVTQPSEHETNECCRTKEVETNDNLEHLWQSLIGEADETNAVENFDQLCASYSKTNMLQNRQIETFSDLHQNYKSNESDKIYEDIVSIEYKQLKLDDYPCTNYFKTIRNIKNKIEIGHKNIDKDSMNGSYSYNINDKNITKKLNSTCSETTPSQKSRENFQEEKENSRQKNNVNITGIQNKRDQKFIDANAFLLQLPKTLHTSTTKQPIEMAMAKKSTKKEGVRNGIYDIKLKEKVLQRNQDNFKLEQNKSESLNYKESDPLKIHNKKLCNTTSPVSCLNKKRILFTDFNSNSKNVDREITYYAWYNKLKCNMKQIEQILYIEELSKPL